MRTPGADNDILYEPTQAQKLGRFAVPVLMALSILGALPVHAASLACTGPAGGPYACDYAADDVLGPYQIIGVSGEGLYNGTTNQTDTGVPVTCTGLDYNFFNQPYDLDALYGEPVTIRLESFSGVETTTTIDCTPAPPPPPPPSCGDGHTAQGMLCSIVAGATGFFYDNAAAVWLTGIALAIVIGLVSWLLARIWHRRRMR